MVEDVEDVAAAVGAQAAEIDHRQVGLPAEVMEAALLAAVAAVEILEASLSEIKVA